MTALEEPPAPPAGFQLETPAAPAPMAAPMPPPGFRLESPAPSLPKSPMPAPIATPANTLNRPGTRYPTNTDEQQAAIDQSRADVEWKQATKDPKTFANSVVVPELNKSEGFKSFTPDEQQKIFLQHIKQQFPKMWEPGQNAALDQQLATTTPPLKPG